MKRITILFLLCFVLFGLISCSTAAGNFETEKYDAKYKSEYGLIVNKLEMKEANFEAFRRVTFYNVRLGEIVFVCEGYSHVQIDDDGDVEIVIKTGEDEFLRHYLGQKQDITYFSEQLKPVKEEERRYKIIWNPKLWIPVFETE